jgi:hypothetical protein
MTDIEPLAATDYDAPLWMQALTYPAGTDRDLIDAVFASGGVIAAGGLAVAPRAAGANMSVDIAPGLVVVAGTDAAGQGKYLGRMKNLVNVPIQAAPSAGLTRIDLVHAHITDATVVGGAVNSLTVETPVAGTPASSNPAVPATPASSVPLAHILVASGTAAISAAMITDVRPRALPPTVQAGRGTVPYQHSTNGCTVIFPVPFPTVCTAVVFNIQFQNTMTNTFLTVLNPTGFSFYAFTAPGEFGDGTQVAVDWIASGY